MRTRKAVLIIAAMAGALMLIGAAPASGAPQTLYTSSGTGPSADVATVPAGICFVTIVADGGDGGAGFTGGPVVPGGAGAGISARVPVTLGGSFSVHVAGAGTQGFGNIGG